MQKELAAREGNKEISWRIDVLNNTVEKELLSKYDDWVADEYRDAAQEPGDDHEVRFWRDLHKGLLLDFKKVGEDERDEIKARHGKTA